MKKKREKKKTVSQVLDEGFIAHRIREIRQKKGLTMRHVSHIADMEQSHYYKIECGVSSPLMSTFLKILVGLDVTWAEFGKIK